MNIGMVKPAGTLSMKVIKAKKASQRNQDSILGILAEANPFASDLPWEIRRWKIKNFHNLWRAMWKIFIAKIFNLPHFYGSLYLKVIKVDGREVNYGLSSLRVVTTAGVNFIATRLNDGATTIGAFDFHGLGTGAIAEAAADTALGTELTTQYSVDSTRATGTPSNPTANEYRTVGTNTVDAAVAITEHGVLSQAATGGGTLLDRTVFSVINLANGDSLQSTYTITLSAGG